MNEYDVSLSMHQPLCATVVDDDYKSTKLGWCDEYCHRQGELGKKIILSSRSTFLSLSQQNEALLAQVKEYSKAWTVPRKSH